MGSRFLSHHNLTPTLSQTEIRRGILRTSMIPNQRESLVTRPSRGSSHPRRQNHLPYAPRCHRQPTSYRCPHSWSRHHKTLSRIRRHRNIQTRTPQGRAHLRAQYVLPGPLQSSIQPPRRPNKYDVVTRGGRACKQKRQSSSEEDLSLPHGMVALSSSVTPIRHRGCLLLRNRSIHESRPTEPPKRRPDVSHPSAPIVLVQERLQEDHRYIMRRSMASPHRPCKPPTRRRLSN